MWPKVRVTMRGNKQKKIKKKLITIMNMIYEVFDDFLLPLIVTRTLGHILCQVLVAKFP